MKIRATVLVVGLALAGCRDVTPPESPPAESAPPAAAVPAPGRPLSSEELRKAFDSSRNRLEFLDSAHPFTYPDRWDVTPDPVRVEVYLAIRERALTELDRAIGTPPSRIQSSGQPYVAALEELGMGPSEFAWLTRRLYGPFGKLWARRDSQRAQRLISPVFDAAVFQAQLALRGRRDGPRDHLARWAYWKRTSGMVDCGAVLPNDVEARRAMVRCIQESIRSKVAFSAIWWERGIDSAVGGGVVDTGNGVFLASYDSYGCESRLGEFCGVRETRCERVRAKLQKDGLLDVTCAAEIQVMSPLSRREK